MTILRALALAATALFLAGCQNPDSPPPDYTTFNNHDSHMNQGVKEAVAVAVEAPGTLIGQPG